jgi:hypothetical protein
VDFIVGIAVGIAATWLVLVVALLVAPRGAVLSEALRLLPDTLRPQEPATDRSLPRGVRPPVAAVAYLAAVEIVPDFVPVLGYADDAIIAVLVLRSVVRRAGPEAIRRHWPGSADGLAALARAASLDLGDAGRGRSE